MPDDNKITDTNLTPLQDTPNVDQSIPPMEPSISTPSPPPAPPAGQDQPTDTPLPATDSTEPPPPPIIEEQEEGGTDIPPVITTGEKPKGKVGKKVIATILGILLLVGGVGAGVILVQRQQDIREKATLFADCERDTDCGSYYVCRDGNCVMPGEPTCEGEGGVCINTPNCFNIGRVLVNRGSGCGLDLCCSQAQTTPTSIPTSGPEHPNCNTNKSLYFPSNCSERLVKDHIIREFCDGDGDKYWCKEWQLDYGVPCWCDRPSGYPNVGKDYWLKPAPGETKLECGITPDSRCITGPTPTSTPKGPTPTPTPTPGVGLRASCLLIRVFDTGWNEITGQLSNLKAGDKVRFTVSGTTSSGSIDKARFRINSPTWRTVVVAKKPGTNDFYDEYTIPEGVTSFTINAQLHHTNLDIGWF